MMSAISAKLIVPRTRNGSAVGGLLDGPRRDAASQSTTQKHGQHQRGDDRGLQPEVPRGPEEVDAAQEADEQRRIAERRERAAHIGDQDDEEHDHMRAVPAPRVGADHRADQDHGGAGGADDAGDAGAERKQCGVDQRRAAQAARHEDAARDGVEREQHAR